MSAPERTSYKDSIASIEFAIIPLSQWHINSLICLCYHDVNKVETPVVLR
jgi:hypothetical protein